MRMLRMFVALLAVGTGTATADPLVGAVGAATIGGHPAIIAVLVRAPSETDDNGRGAA
jgi:hypothetical protein